MHNPLIRPLRRRQAGVTMIELLVSILIFAFGMLGLVGLQNKTLGYGQVSLLRSQATALSDDILDRMRTDRTNAKTQAWATELDEASADITGSTIAQTDLKDWKAAVEQLLPSGKAQIIIDTDHVTVIIQWQERSDSNGNAVTTQFTTVSAL
jgi:type IV pilus assembly protein PilV